MSNTIIFALPFRNTANHIKKIPKTKYRKFMRRTTEKFWKFNLSHNYDDFQGKNEKEMFS